MLYGPHKRFSISIVVRDADLISDQEVQEGKRPPIVYETSANLDPCTHQRPYDREGRCPLCNTWPTDSIEVAKAWCQAQSTHPQE